MAKTFSFIASASSDGTVSTLTFSNIPTDYKHLWLIGAIGGSSATSPRLRFNGDTGNNYAFQEIYSSGTGITNNRDLAQNNATGNSSIYATSDGGVLGFEALIPNYLWDSKYTQVLWDANSGRYSYATAHGVNVRSTQTWKNTAAITSITVDLPSGTMTNTSKVTLYGLL